MKKEAIILKNKSNTLLLISNNNALLIDCGYDYEDTNKIIAYLKENHLNLEEVIITHYHRDHIGGIVELLKEFNNIKIYCTDETRIIYNNKWFEDNFYFINTRNRMCSIKKMKRLPSKLKFHDFIIKYIKLNGHCIGNVSLILDNILFCSDIVTSNDSNLPFISDVDEYLDNLKVLKNLKNIDKVVLTHSNEESITYTEFTKKIFSTEEIINKYVQIVLQNINGMKYDCFINKMINKNVRTHCFKDEFDIEQYSYTKYVLDNIINYLVKKDLIEVKLLNNDIYLERK